jgi:hypothetical protein
MNENEIGRALWTVRLSFTGNLAVLAFSKVFMKKHWLKNRMGAD